MHRHAAGHPDRLVQPVARAALLVEGVPRLVHHPHQGLGEIVLVVAGGDAHVAGGTAAEGMQRHVQPPTGEVEARRAHQPLAQRLLVGDGEGSHGPQRRRLGGLPVEDAPDQLRQEAGQTGKQGVDPLGAGAGVMLVQHGVVGRQAHGRRLGLAALADTAQHLRQAGQQLGEVAFRPRAAPRHLAGRDRLAGCLDQVAGDGGGVAVGAPHLPQVGRLPCVQPARALRLGQPVGHAGFGLQLVGQHGQGGGLLGPPVAGTVGHHGLAVPAQDAQGVADGGDAGETAFQLPIGGCHGCNS